MLVVAAAAAIMGMDMVKVDKVPVLLKLILKWRR